MIFRSGVWRGRPLYKHVSNNLYLYWFEQTNWLGWVIGTFFYCIGLLCGFTTRTIFRTIIFFLRVGLALKNADSPSTIPENHFL